MEATNPALAQNINDLLTIFRGDRQRVNRRPQPGGDLADPREK
jgi:hypothetical protein